MVDKNKQLMIFESTPRPPIFSIKSALDHAKKNPAPMGYEWSITTVQGLNDIRMSIRKPLTTRAENYRNRDRDFSI